VQQAVDELLVAGHAEDFVAGLPELRHELQSIL
jgi:hypothetical protein